MRRNIFTISIISLSIFASGCGATWVKPGSTAMQAQEEYEKCQYEVQLHAGGMNGTTISAIDLGYRRGTLMNRCMHQKGYYVQR